MKSFLARFGALIAFSLSGFDRLRFVGESRLLNSARGLDSYLYQRHIRYVDFPAHAEGLTRRLRAATERRAAACGLAVVPLNCAAVDKEALALDLAARHGRTSGPLAVLSAVEICQTYRLRKGPNGWVKPVKERAKCVHYYHYFRHPELGLGYVRVQSWFPFAVRVGLNGRQWLYRQLANRGVPFAARRNLLVSVADPEMAQALPDAQPRADWPALLGDLVRPAQPLWDYLHTEARTPYYWMAEQTEWATDFVFRDPAGLAAWYRRFVRHGLDRLGCRDVLRYLGKKVPDRGYGSCAGEAKIDLRDRPEGTRLKFWYGTNSVKVYDKEAAAFRIETTVNRPDGFRVYRTKEGDPADAPKAWHPMRKGVADLPRRAEVSQAANGRLAESLATAAEPVTLGELVRPLGRPVVADGRRVARALNPLGGPDGELLRAVGRGEFLVNGFRNRDVRAALYGPAADPDRRRRQGAKVTRLLALLRAHGLIVKVTKTHRYHLSAAGRRVATALVAADATDVGQLTAA